MFSYTFFLEHYKDNILRALLVCVTLSIPWANTKIVLKANKDKFTYWKFILAAFTGETSVENH